MEFEVLWPTLGGLGDCGGLAGAVTGEDEVEENHERLFLIGMGRGSAFDSVKGFGGVGGWT